MKCPLLGLDEQNREWAHKAKQTVCLGEECEGWDKMSGRCSVYRVMTCLESIAGSLKAICDKMRPHVPSH